MRINEIIEQPTVTLYHGTCFDSAKQILTHGWSPNLGSVGSNFGQTKYLYLTTDKEDALWFAQEKGCDTVLKVSNVPLDFLKVDPEDGIEDNVRDELFRHNRRIPGKVVLYKPIGAEYFTIV